MLEIKHLTKSFGKKQVLNDINITFDSGVYGLLGPNGSGKTTMLRSIIGLYPTKKGTVLFNNMKANSSEYYSQLGYLSQNFGLFKDLTVKEVLELFATLKKLDRKIANESIEEAISRVNLTEQTDTKCSELSGGMVRRVGIAQALLGNPKIIILDEPTVGLDPEERLRLKNAICNLSKDKTIIISTHIVEDVEALCDKIVIMNSGKILVNDTINKIADIAKGKVYGVPDSELSSIKGNYHIEKQYTEDGVKYARVLSKVALDYETLKPTVEDGYIYAINENENIF